MSQILSTIASSALMLVRTRSTPLAWMGPPKAKALWRELEAPTRLKTRGTTSFSGNG
jgi:hypothetical protein